MRADAEATKLQGQKASNIIVSTSAYYVIRYVREPLSVYQLNGMRALFLYDLEQFDIEDQHGVRRNPALTARTVG